MELEAYRKEAQEFLTRYVQERNDFHAGLKETLELEAIFGAHKRLFSQPSIGELFAVHEKAVREEKRRTQYLLGFAVETALSRHVSQEDQQISRVLASTPVRVGAETMSFHEATVSLANEPDRGRRDAIHAARAAVQGATDAARVARLKKMHEMARELSGMPYLECTQFVMGANFHLLRGQIEAFLAASKERYQRELALFAARFLGGLRPEEARPSDMAYLFRGRLFDTLFPKDRLLSVLKRTLMGLGIDLKKQTNIRIDAEERRNKHSDAATFGIRIPSRIYLVLRLRGGLEDYLALLRKAGQALHLGHIAEDQAFEYKYLGDAAVAETYGALFQGLTMNPDWIEDQLEAADGGEFLQFNRFRKLYMLRRYAAEFLYEVELHEGSCYDAAELKDRYARSLSAALGFAASAEEFLSAVEEPFYGTAFLRAWIFEAELRQKLEERYGKRWYSRPAAGGYLRDLWSFGTKYTVEELAKQIRLQDLDLEPLKRDLT